MPDDLRLNIDHAAIAALVHDEPIRQHTLTVGKRIADLAAPGAPHRTGAGALSMDAWPGHDAAGWFADVSWDQDHFYLSFGELGTSHRAEHPFLRPVIDRYLYLK